MSPIRFSIRELRLGKGWSQTELAEKAGTRQATISNLENGRSRRIEIDLLDRLAKVFSVQPGELIIQEKKVRR